MELKIEVKYLKNVDSPPNQVGKKGDVKELPVLIARGLASNNYVKITKKEKTSGKETVNKRTNPKIK